ncbi:MAG: type II toxin-antitoxin system PemK/MazF family toxin [Cypionkella sp.]
MLSCERGDIVVVPFPFTDIAFTKRRPALVLSRRQFNAQSAHTILAMITSAAHSRWPSDIPLPAGPETGLSHASVIRWKLFTLSNDLISHKAGSLDEVTLAVVNQALAAMLELH